MSLCCGWTVVFPGAEVQTEVNGVSYLDSPRLHFRGWFQADVSTINNDVTAYDVSPSAAPADPGWNPEGTGIFRFLDCIITGGFLCGKQITPQSGDTLTGATIQIAVSGLPASWSISIPSSKWSP
jgi:hypothetical protein